MLYVVQFSLFSVWFLPFIFSRMGWRHWLQIWTTLLFDATKMWKTFSPDVRSTGCIHHPHQCLFWTLFVVYSEGTNVNSIIFCLGCMQALTKLMFPLYFLLSSPPPPPPPPPFISFSFLSMVDQVFLIGSFFCDWIVLQDMFFSSSRTEWIVLLFMHYPSIFLGIHSTWCSPVLLTEMYFPVHYCYCLICEVIFGVFTGMCGTWMLTRNVSVWIFFTFWCRHVLYMSKTMWKCESYFPHWQEQFVWIQSNASLPVFPILIVI